jgi:ribonucleoside-diphosphate reductase beta chain
MVENRIYMGNGNIISLILQDEMLHTDWTALLINRVVKDDPRFAKRAKERNAAKRVLAMYMEVIAEEKDWAKHLFSMARSSVSTKHRLRLRRLPRDGALKDIGIKVPEEIKQTQNPIPWFNKHTNLGAKQVALQEQETTSYIIGAMGGDRVPLRCARH